MSSRAAQRKRKRQAKLGGNQGRTQVQLPGTNMLSKISGGRHQHSDDSDDDEDENDDEKLHFGGDYDDDEEEEEQGYSDGEDDYHHKEKPTPKKAKFHSEGSRKNSTSSTTKAKLNDGIEELFSVAKVETDVLSHLKMSLADILALEDVKDVTCTQKAALLLSKIISPTDRTLFYQLYWEQNPLQSALSSSRDKDESSTANFIGKLFPMKEFKRILRENVFVLEQDIILYGKSFDYLQKQPSVDGPAVLKTFLKSDVKCGIRLLEPQKFCTSLWQLASALEFEFQSRVSTEITVQSPDFLGFSKEFVTVEHDQFIVQLEGSSGWNIAESRNKVTDHIVVEDEVDGDKDGINSKKTSAYFLAAGDSLYIPKGRPFRQTSLHPTETNVYLCLGTNRNRAVHNLMSLVVPQAIENLAVESKKLRQALPLTLNHYVGVAVSETETEENPLGDKRRHAFLQYIEKQIMPLITDQVLDIIDPAVDQMNKALVMERLPVPLTIREEKSTAAGFSEAVIFPYTQVRMLRPGIATIAIEDGKIVLYHCMDNARSLFGNEMSPMEFELDDGPAIETLLKSYPDSVMVSDLPHPGEDMEDKVGVAQALYKEGLLYIVDETSKPGYVGSDDEENESVDGKMTSLL